MKLKQLLFISLLFLEAFSFAQNKNPFQSIGKKGEILTLTKGTYEELFDQDSIQQIGTTFINVRTMKIVSLGNDKNEDDVMTDNSRHTRFKSIDPLTSSYPMLTPYQFASNRPIDGIDIDGLEYESSMASDKIRDFEAKLRKSDPANADQIISNYKLNAFVTVGGMLSLGSGTALKAIGYTWAFYQAQRVFEIMNRKAVTPEQKKENIAEFKDAGADIFMGLGAGYLLGRVSNSFGMFKSNETHIDIGGYGRYPNAKNYTTSGVDYEGKAIPNLIQGRAEINLKQVTANSIDKITIENAPFTDPIMTEAARVLKPSGQLNITTPTPGEGVFESIAKRFNLKLQSTTTTMKADGAGGTYEMKTAIFIKLKKE